MSSLPVAWEIKNIKGGLVNLLRDKGGKLSLAQIKVAMGQRHAGFHIDEALRILRTTEVIGFTKEANDWIVRLRKDPCAIKTGDRFGNLVAQERGPDYVHPDGKNKKTRWYFRCDCGGQALFAPADVIRNVKRGWSTCLSCIARAGGWEKSRLHSTNRLLPHKTEALHDRPRDD